MSENVEATQSGQEQSAAARVMECWDALRRWVWCDVDDDDGVGETATKLTQMADALRPELERLLAQLTWSDAPTNPGWYWADLKHRGKAVKGIFQVIFHEGRAFIRLNASNAYAISSIADARFAGPILEPGQ